MMDVGRKTKMEKTTAKHMSTAQMTVTALMTAITCILAPMALPIPISPVPISLTNLGVYSRNEAFRSELCIIPALRNSRTSGILRI